MEPAEDIDTPKKISIDAVKGWTKEEKFHLLAALKAYGSGDVERIRYYVSTKNLEETRLAIEYYKSIAMEHPSVKKIQQAQNKKTRKPRVPLASWANLLTDKLSSDELHTQTATAVRMLADLEEIPPPTCTDGIDFRKVYHTIADAMEGKAVSPDMVTTAVLSKCITETALSSKAFFKTSEYKYVLNTTDLSDEEINTFPKPTPDQELANVRHLSSQKNYNPFRVPEEYLKPSCDTTLKGPKSE